MKHLFCILLAFFLFVGCNGSEDKKKPQTQTKSAWSVAAHRYMNKWQGSYVALPVPYRVLSYRFTKVKRCNTRTKVCTPLQTKAIVFNKRGKVRLVTFVFFHHAPGYRTPALVHKAFKKEGYVAWSCNMHSWPQGMKKHALYTKDGHGRQHFIELPTNNSTFTYKGKRYWWYEFRPIR